MLTLYQALQYICPQKCRLTLAEKGVEYVRKDLEYMDLFSPEYLKLNPNAYVPTLVHDDRVIIESSIIMNYVDDAFEGPPLKPGDAYGRARVAFILKMIDERIHHAINTLSFATTLRQRWANATKEELENFLARIPDFGRREHRRRTIELGLDGPDVAPSLLVMEHFLRDLEDGDLAHGPWMAGAAYSLADAAVVPYMLRLENMSCDGMWADKPRLADWYDRVRARPSYAETITEFEDKQHIGMLRQTGAAAWPKFREILDAA